MPYRWLGKRREREIINICNRHFEKVVQVVEELKNLVVNFEVNQRGKVEENFHVIFNLEREADNIKEEIINQLYRGPLHPMDREDIMRLILTSDDIAAHAKAAGRKLLYIDPGKVPEDIRAGIRSLTEQAINAVYHLKTALNSLLSNPERAIKEAERVERVEEEVDEYRVKLIAEILEWGDAVKSISRLLMIKEAIENIENMTDRAEDTADVIRGLAVIG